jgi:glucokinase
MMYLGIEIGGTKLQSAVGSGGTLAEIARASVLPDAGAEGIRKQLQEMIPRLLATHPIEAIGIGFGGPLDVARGIVTTSHQVEGWDNFPLAAWCREQFRLPTALANDCDAAALAEATWGAGRGNRTVFYVTVGTGVGGGLVIDRALHGQDRPAAAEIGHLRPGLKAVSPDDIVESYSSGRGIERRLQQLVQDSPHDPEAFELIAAQRELSQPLSAREIAALAGEGNRLALRVLDDACRTLGWAIAQTATLIAPNVVVIGGGVSLMPDSLFLEPVRQAVEQYLFAPLRGSFRIEPSALGEEVVLHGALAVAESSSLPET